MLNKNSAILAFEDGSVFEGIAFGAKTTEVGEAVFNTSVTGYQEILTDPSYFGQIVTMTTPHIGNYGVNEEDIEADKPMVKGFVVKELSKVYSNWRATHSLGDYLKENGIPGIEGVDTRSITKKLRTAGAMKCCLSTEGLSKEEAVEKAKNWKGLEGVDYAKEVTCAEPYEFDPDFKLSETFALVGTTIQPKRLDKSEFTVAAIDFGAKK